MSRALIPLMLLLTCGVPTGTTLTGTVTDPTGSAIVGALVILDGPRGRTVVRTTTDGFYSTVLPRGTYRMRIDRAGFCSARRAPFVAPDAAHRSFSFRIMPCAIGDSFTVEGGSVVGMKGETRGGYTYEELAPFGAKGCELTAVVAFGESKRDQRLTHYSSLRVNNSSSPVVLTYNRFTIYSDSLDYDEQLRQFTAKGGVRVEDGTGQGTARRERIDWTWNAEAHSSGDVESAPSCPVLREMAPLGY